MIIINPIPGQEEENAVFLENKGAAITLKKGEDIDKLLFNILNDQKTLRKMKINAKLLAKRNSTKDICEILLDLK